MNAEKIDIDQNLYNLYKICLNYYTQLDETKHPKINLITEVLDLLIELRQNKELVEVKIKLEEEFNKIHSKAYNNINLIYDYDKEVEDNKKIEEII